MNRKILLTFDLEEFDLPIEYNIEIAKEKQLEVTNEGLTVLLKILEKYSIIATFFTTAYYAENNPKIIKKIVNSGHELGSHLYYHSDYNPIHILTSKQKLEEISGVKIHGIRSPRLRPLSIENIKKAGYTYNSSLNPTFIPGRYNNFNKPRKIFKNNNLFIIPFSVATIFRFPLFWLSFKNIPLRIYIFLCKRAIKKDGYLHLYFHPWEFANLKSFNIPMYIKKISEKKMTNKFELFLQTIQNRGNFTTINQFINKCEN